MRVNAEERSVWLRHMGNSLQNSAPWAYWDDPNAESDPHPLMSARESARSKTTAVSSYSRSVPATPPPSTEPAGYKKCSGSRSHKSNESTSKANSEPAKGPDTLHAITLPPDTPSSARSVRSRGSRRSCKASIEDGTITGLTLLDCTAGADRTSTPRSMTSSTKRRECKKAKCNAVKAVGMLAGQAVRGLAGRPLLTPTKEQPLPESVGQRQAIPASTTVWAMRAKATAAAKTEPTGTQPMHPVQRTAA